jgi:hypothetical protein
LQNSVVSLVNSNLTSLPTGILANTIRDLTPTSVLGTWTRTGVNTVSVSYPEPLIATHTYLSTLYYTDPPGGGVPITSTIVDVIPGSLRILRINITSSTMTFNITSNESSGRAIALFIQ